MKIFQMLITSTAVLVGTSLIASAQDQGPRKAVLQRLEAEYTITKPTNDKTDIVAAGAVLTLQKDKLIMSTPTNFCLNTYKDGRFTQNAGCKGNAMLGHFTAFGHPEKSPTRTFISGEKFWVTKIDVKDAGIESAITFEFLSDAIHDVRFHSSLTIPFSNGLPLPDDALKAIREVVTATPSGDVTQGDSQPALPAIAPPPPPSDNPPSPPPTVALGQTPDQVAAILGQPLRKAVVGAKQIYFYQDMKITFLNGRVKDIQ